MACPEDALDFDLSELVVETIRAEEAYPGKRARFRTLLGKARVPVQLDIGVGNALAGEPEESIPRRISCDRDFKRSDPTPLSTRLLAQELNGRAPPVATLSSSGAAPVSVEWLSENLPLWREAGCPTSR